MKRKKQEFTGFKVLPGGIGLISVAVPVKCECGRMAMLLVNRFGKTRCIACDTKFVENTPGCVQGF